MSWFIWALLSALFAGITAILAKIGVAGTAYGMLGVVNVIGDCGSSLVVGLSWTAVGPTAAFLYAVVVGAAGTLLMALTKGNVASSLNRAPRT